jgi:hypothetical protein
VGDKYIKIVSEQPNVDGRNMIKMVTANNLYYRPPSPTYTPPSTPPQFPPPTMSVMPTTMQEGGHYNHMYNVPHTTPHITIAPTFKLIGGNDFSTGNETQSEPSTTQTNDIIVPTQTSSSKNNIELIPEVAEKPEEKTQTSSGEIDFNNLIIKKQQ